MNDLGHIYELCEEAECWFRTLKKNYRVPKVRWGSFFGHFLVKIVPRQRNLWRPNFTGKSLFLPGKCLKWPKIAHEWSLEGTFMNFSRKQNFNLGFQKKNYGTPKLRWEPFFGHFRRFCRKMTLIATLEPHKIFFKALNQNSRIIESS